MFFLSCVQMKLFCCRLHGSISVVSVCQFSKHKRIRPSFKGLFADDGCNSLPSSNESSNERSEIVRSNDSAQQSSAEGNSIITGHSPKKVKHRSQCINVSFTKSTLNDICYKNMYSTNECIENLIKIDRAEEAVALLNEKNNIEKCFLRIKSIRILCSIAAQSGNVAAVKKLQELSALHHPTFFKENLGLFHYLGQAEFYAGFYSKSLITFAVIFNLTLPDDYNWCHTSYDDILEYFEKKQHSRVLTKQEWDEIYHKKLKDSLIFVIKHLIDVEDATVWKQAEALVRLLIFQYDITLPCFTLWLAYMSTDQVSDADALLEKEVKVVQLFPKKIDVIISLLIRCNDRKLVEHTIRVLLRHRLERLLSPVASLLLSMQCTEDNAPAVLETLKFCHVMRVQISAGALLRAQNVLADSGLPLPLEILLMKYPNMRKPSKPPKFHF